MRTIHNTISHVLENKLLKTCRMSFCSMLKYTQVVFNVIARSVRYDADICNEMQIENNVPNKLLNPNI